MARMATKVCSKQGAARALALIAGAACASCADQPPPKCTVARGDFAATYTLISGEGECAELKGEVIGVQAYNARTSETDDRPDYDWTSIGIQPQTISDLLAAGAVDPDADHAPYALGDFRSSEPDADGFCVAPELSVARLQSAEVPEQVDECTTTPALPAVDITYEWSDVRVYATAAALGTQLSARLTYTKDGCTAEYRVRAVYPAVSCGAVPLQPEPSEPEPEPEPATDEDAGVEPCPPEEEASGGTPVADSSLCSPEPNPEQGLPTGSGLSPDIAITCDPDLLLCVLEADPPSRR